MARVIPLMPLSGNSSLSVQSHGGDLLHLLEDLKDRADLCRIWAREDGWTSFALMLDHQTRPPP